MIHTATEFQDQLEHALHRLHVTSLKALGEELRGEDFNVPKINYLKGQAQAYDEAKRACRELRRGS